MTLGIAALKKNNNNKHNKKKNKKISLAVHNTLATLKV